MLFGSFKKKNRARCPFTSTVHHLGSWICYIKLCIKLRGNCSSTIVSLICGLMEGLWVRSEVCSSELVVKQCMNRDSWFLSVSALLWFPLVFGKSLGRFHTFLSWIITSDKFIRFSTCGDIRGWFASTQMEWIFRYFRTSHLKSSYPFCVPYCIWDICIDQEDVTKGLQESLGLLQMQVDPLVSL